VTKQPGLSWELTSPSPAVSPENTAPTGAARCCSHPSQLGRCTRFRHAALQLSPRLHLRVTPRWCVAMNRKEGNREEPPPSSSSSTVTASYCRKLTMGKKSTK